MPMQLAIYDTPSLGTLLLECSHLAHDVTFSTNEHGFESCSWSMPLAQDTAFMLYSQIGIAHVQLVASGGVRVWEGRLEDISIKNGGASFTALGYWSALNDVPYSALWSTTDITQFRPVLTAEWGDTFPDRFAFDTSHDYLQITPQKGSKQGNDGVTNVVGRMALLTPDMASTVAPQSFVGCQFTFDFLAPAGWNVVLQSYSGTPGSTWTYLSSFWSDSGSGALKQGRVWLLHGGIQIYAFLLYYSGGAGSLAAETGDIYLRISNWRAVTSSDTQVYATTTAIIGSGSNVSVPVNSTRYMYPGQSIIFSGSGGTSITTVASVTNSTTFVATTVAAVHGAGALVLAHNTTTSNTAKAMVGAAAATNASQISSSTALIQETERDQTDALYEDASITDALTDMCKLGDNTSPPRQWEVGIYENRMLHFRPRGSAGKQWFVDIEQLEAQKTLSELYNTAYAVYQSPSGRTLRTTNTSDTASIARYGITRIQSVKVDTTSLGVAQIQRNAVAEDGRVPKPRFSISFKALFDSAGTRWPLWMLRSGDTITIRNLPPALVASTDVDRIRTFRVARTEYNADSRSIGVEPEKPLPTLEVLATQG